MFLWNRLPVAELERQAGAILHRGRHDTAAGAADSSPEPAMARQEEGAPATVPPLPPAHPSASDTTRPAAAAAPTAAATGNGTPASADARPGIRVQVLNGSGVRLMAAQAADGLRRLRYDVRETGNAPADLDKSTVVSRVQDPAPSLRLAQDLGLSSARIRYEEDPRLVDVDVTLILGADYQKLPIMGKK